MNRVKAQSIATGVFVIGELIGQDGKNFVKTDQGNLVEVKNYQIRKSKNVFDFNGNELFERDILQSKYTFSKKIVGYDEDDCSYIDDWYVVGQLDNDAPKEKIKTHRAKYYSGDQYLIEGIGYMYFNDKYILLQKEDMSLHLCFSMSLTENTLKKDSRNNYIYSGDIITLDDVKGTVHPYNGSYCFFRKGIDYTKKESIRPEKLFDLEGEIKIVGNIFTN